MKKELKFASWMLALGLGAVIAHPAQAQRGRFRNVDAAPQHPQKQKQHPDRQPARQDQHNANRPPGSSESRAPNTNRPPERARNQQNTNRPPASTPPRTATPQERQKNEQHFNQLTPQQKQELRDRQQTWAALTPEQRHHIKNDVMPRWQQLPPQRQKAIQQRLGVLKSMPESARNQHLSDPNFTRGMSEEDKGMLRDLSHLHVGGAPEEPHE